MIKCNNFLDCIDKIKLFAEIMRPFNFPNISSELENKLMPFKCWNVKVDGCDLIVQYSESEINEYMFNNIQIFSENVFGIPFHVSFKVAALVLNDLNNSVFFSYIKDERNIMSWTKVKNIKTNKVQIDEANVFFVEYMGKKFAIIPDI